MHERHILHIGTSETLKQPLFQKHTVYPLINDYSALFSPLIITAVVVKWLERLALVLGIAGSNPGRADFSVDFIYFYSWIGMRELFRYTLLFFLNYYFKFERNLS